MQDRKGLMQAVRGMEDKQQPDMGMGGGLSLEIADYPELKGKKEGDTVSISFMVSGVSGTSVSLEHAGMPGEEKQPMPPAKDEPYMEPGAGGKGGM